MKKAILTLAIVICIVGTISTLQGQQPETKNVMVSGNLHTTQKNAVNAKQDLIKTQTNFITEIQNFRKKAEIRIKCNEKVFADFKVNLSKLNQLDKDTFKKMVGELEHENTILKNKLLNYKKDEGPVKWKAFKRTFNRDMDVLGVRMWNVN